MFCQVSLKGKHSRGKYFELKYHKSGLMSHLLTSKWHTRPQAKAFKIQQSFSERACVCVCVCVCSQAAIQRNLFKRFKTDLLLIWAVIYTAVVSVSLSERTDSGHYWTLNEHTLSHRTATPAERSQLITGLHRKQAMFSLLTAVKSPSAQMRMLVLWYRHTISFRLTISFSSVRKTSHSLV